MAFFKKVACFTDIHFGLKGNSRVHNDDCEAFVIWFIEQAKAEGCETCIFLGDWHHHRSATNVSTMNYTVSNMERLGAAFEKVYVIATVLQDECHGRDARCWHNQNRSLCRLR